MNSNDVSEQLNTTSFSRLTVDTLVDDNDGDLSPGDVSLREAIDYVSAGGTIDFAPSLENGTIVLEHGELLIDKDLNIDGLGASKLTISGDTFNPSRIFRVDDGYSGNQIDVLIKSVTIENGSVGPGEVGGGILNQENLELRNSNVRYSDAEFGGGIANYGSLSIALTTISNNSATFGAGIANYGSLTTSEMAIRDNQASSEGGGIYNENGTVNITQASIRNNQALWGGGIYNWGSDAMVTLINVGVNENSANLGGGVYNSSGATANFSEFGLHDNTASESGGGIYNTNGTVSVSHAGIGSNSADVSGGGVYNSAGGTVYLSQLEVTENNTPGYGGGFFNDTDSQLDVSFALLRGNGGYHGGGIFNGGLATLRNSTASENGALLAGEFSTKGVLHSMLARSSTTAPRTVRVSTTRTSSPCTIARSPITVRRLLAAGLTIAAMPSFSAQPLAAIQPAKLAVVFLTVRTVAFTCITAPSAAIQLKKKSKKNMEVGVFTILAACMGRITPSLGMSPFKVEGLSPLPPVMPNSPVRSWRETSITMVPMAAIPMFRGISMPIAASISSAMERGVRG